MWDSETESLRGRESGNGALIPAKHGLKTDGFQQRGQSWYVYVINILSFFYFEA